MSGTVRVQGDGTRRPGERGEYAHRRAAEDHHRRAEPRDRAGPADPLCEGLPRRRAGWPELAPAPLTADADLRRPDSSGDRAGPAHRVGGRRGPGGARRVARAPGCSRHCSSAPPWGCPAASCSPSRATRWPRRTPSPSTPARTSRSCWQRSPGSRCRSRSNGALAFVGGLAASALVLAIARGGAEGPTRLVLAGSATMLALSSLTILSHAPVRAGDHGDVRVGRGLDRAVRYGQGHPGGTGGAAGRGRPSCSGRAASTCSRWATTPRPVLGLDVRRTRVVSVLLAVLLGVSSRSRVAGPIGFVGLTAPVIARLVAGRVPGHGPASPAPAAGRPGGVRRRARPPTCCSGWPVPRGRRPSRSRPASSPPCSAPR